MHRRSFLAVVLAFIVVFMAGGSSALAQATPPNLALNVRWGAAGNWNSGPSNMFLVPDPNDPNKWTFSGGTTQTDWAATWSGNVDVDPAINSALVFTNNTAVDQTFITTLTLPTVGAIAAPSTISGGTTISVTGVGVPETISTPAGDWMYRALIGGLFVGPPADLIGAPFALSTPNGLPAAFGPVNFGPANGPALAAADTIAIRNAFTLTPGASATLNSTFIVVPEPATAMALIPLAGLIVARRRRD